jgi:hypothetical protein
LQKESPLASLSQKLGKITGEGMKSTLGVYKNQGFLVTEMKEV